MAHAWIKLNSSKENGVTNACINSLPMARTTKSIVVDGCKTQVYEDELKKRIEEELYRGFEIGDIK